MKTTIRTIGNNDNFLIFDDGEGGIIIRTKKVDSRGITTEIKIGISDVPAEMTVTTNKSNHWYPREINGAGGFSIRK